MMSLKINRRRFISISAAAFSIGVIDPAHSMANNTLQLVRWQGAALGAQAEIMLYVDDPSKAHETFARCQNEIRRLENIFSLYHTDSAINQLNKQGYLDNPDIEFLELLSRCISCYGITDGAFDVTIQPLWQLYADHFSQIDAAPSGPSKDKIAQVLTIIGSDKIILDGRQISFTKSGMAISLNGVAQGYITDRVSKILRDAGFGNILVDLGEAYALGKHADGRAWTAGISSPFKENQILFKVPLEQKALATSGGYGSPFSAQGLSHHLLDPRTGYSANHHSSLSIVAKDATTADMLSTAFYVMPFESVSEVWTKYPQLEKAFFIDSVGKITEFIS